MRVVTPYREQAPESTAHVRLGPFDWCTAIEMLRISVNLACGCETVVLSDQWTRVPGGVFRYHTKEPRLMLWLLEVWLAYLRSDDFDQDTAMLSPDILVYHDLRKLFKADLSLIIRSGDKYREKPLLNGAQFWRVSAKAALVDFYEQVLELGHQCNEAEKRWGADTTPILALIEPLQDGPVHAGKMQRSDLSICGLEAFSCFRTIKLGELKGKNKVSWPAVPIIDFKSRRKQSMAAFYHATIGSRVPA